MALLSDVHGNLEALDAVFRDIDRACYAVFDGDRVTYRRVPYDVRSAMRKLAAQDGALAGRLAIGR